MAVTQSQPSPRHGEASPDGETMPFVHRLSHPTSDKQPLFPPSPTPKARHDRRRRKPPTIWAQLRTWLVSHQLAIAVTLLSLLAFFHLNLPSEKFDGRKFIGLSYYNPRTRKYGIGRDDNLIVAFWVILLTGLRAGVLDYILVPLASRTGTTQKKTQLRIAEQAWLLCYHGTIWCSGMYIWYNSSYWLNLRALWTNSPFPDIDGNTKYYYLVVLAFWLQQLVIINIEKRRKDHVQMFIHHLITCALILSSYCYRMTRVGNVILCLMDVVDLFLPLAKIFRYLQYRMACDTTFGAFMVTWFFARHVCYMTVCWSIHTHLHQEIQPGCYRHVGDRYEGPFPASSGFYRFIEPFFNPTALLCCDATLIRGFLFFLLTLQVILLIWFGMIVKVAYKVLSGQGADDSRSDDEDSEIEDVKESDPAIERIKLCKEPTFTSESTRSPIEVEVDLDEMALSGSRSNNGHLLRKTSRKSEGHNDASSGVSFRGSSDRKQLLGRIGCDKDS